MSKEGSYRLTVTISLDLLGKNGKKPKIRETPVREFLQDADFDGPSAVSDTLFFLQHAFDKILRGHLSITAQGINTNKNRTVSWGS